MSDLSTLPRPRSFRWIRRVHLLAQAHGDRIARGHGLTLQQWELLARLRAGGGMVDQRDLCAHFAVTPPTLSALVDSAVEHGWVERFPHPDDRRRKRVAITPAGAAVVRTAPHLGREVGRCMTAGFSDEERVILSRLLERAARNLEEPA